MADRVNPPSPEDARCSRCRFFEGIYNRAPAGTCHRHAPTIGHSWPAVDAGDWCGEFGIIDERGEDQT